MNDERLRQLYRQHAANASGDRKDCVRLEALVAIVENTAAPAERTATLEHVMRCTRCQSELELLRAIAAGTAEAGQAADRVTPSARRRTPMLWRWRPGAPLSAAALLMLLLGGSLLWSRFRGDEVITRGDDAAVPIIAPTGTVASPVTLMWRPVSDALEYRVELVNDADAAVLSTATRDTTLAVPPNLLANDRTYRWWVSAILRSGTRVSSVPVSFSVRAR